MTDDNIHLKFAHLIEVLEALKKPKYTRQLLEELDDFRKHELLKEAIEKGLVKREKDSRRQYNVLTEKGRDMLANYNRLLEMID